MSQAPAEDTGHRAEALHQPVGPSLTPADVDPRADDRSERDLTRDPLVDLAVFRLRAEEIIERTRLVGERTESWLLEHGLPSSRPPEGSGEDAVQQGD